MRIIARIPYDAVEWVWITDHCDIHFRGLCRYKGRLCKFLTIDDEQCPYFEPKCVKIYELTKGEKLKWLTRKKLFEWFVGYHWSYPMTGKALKARRPRWLWEIAEKTYYQMLNKRY